MKTCSGLVTFMEFTRFAKLRFAALQSKVWTNLDLSLRNMVSKKKRQYIKFILTDIFATESNIMEL